MKIGFLPKRGYLKGADLEKDEQIVALHAAVDIPPGDLENYRGKFHFRLPVLGTWEKKSHAALGNMSLYGNYLGDFYFPEFTETIANIQAAHQKAEDVLKTLR